MSNVFSVASQCETTLVAGLSCIDAPIFTPQDFEDGKQYCSTLPIDNLIPQLNPFCMGAGVPNNTGLFQFYPASSSLTFIIDPFLCDTIMNGAGEFVGVQAGVFLACDFANPVFCASTCQSSVFEIILQDLIPGQLYTLAIDGCAGSVCTFSISLSDGELLIMDPLADPAVNGPTFICENEMATYTISNLPQTAEVNWQIDPAISFTTLNGGQILQLSEMPVFDAYGICAIIETMPPNGVVIDTCFSLEVYEAPNIISVSNDTSLCAGDVFDIQLEVENTATIVWTAPANTLSCLDCLTPTFTMSEAAAQLEVSLTNSDTGCETTHSIQIDLKEAAACTNSLSGAATLESIQIYPNPGHAEIFIRSEQDLGELSILNSIGQELLRIAGDKKNVRVDMNQFPKGIYFVKITKPDGGQALLPWLKQ